MFQTTEIILYEVHVHFVSLTKYVGNRLLLCGFTRLRFKALNVEVMSVHMHVFVCLFVR